MKVIGIVGSPRKDGNTEILVKEALKGAEENGAKIELIKTSDLKISPCDGCEHCHQKGLCKLEDDMNFLFQKILGSNGIILGSPVYFWAVSSQVKIIMDRTYALRYPYHRLKNKVCGGIVVAGRRGCMSALQTMNSFFLGQDMIPVGVGIAGYANNKGEITTDIRAMNGARSLGKQITDTIKLINSN